ncbi:MAG: hypothetical protein ABIT08_05105 [Bacteroidia bacterium]
MMELIVAILLSLGALTTDSDFNDDYQHHHSIEISKVKTIIDNGQYRIDESTGGVVVDPGVGI